MIDLNVMVFIASEILQKKPINLIKTKRFAREHGLNTIEIVYLQAKDVETISKRMTICFYIFNNKVELIKCIIKSMHNFIIFN